MSMALVNEPSGDGADVAARLASALHGTMIATAKAQTYHWNVTGMAFGPLHALFQEIYEDHFAAQDRIAERIRALGGHVDGRPSTAIAGSAVEECGGAIGPEASIRRLAGDQRTLSAGLGDTARLADERGDLVSHDLAVERMDAHDKFAWMLEAHLPD